MIKKKLITKIKDLESFLKENQLSTSAAQEILFILIHFIVPENEENTDGEILDRLIKLSKGKILDYEKFSNEYFLKVGVINAALIDHFLENINNQPLIQEIMDEISTMLAKKLSSEEKNFLINVFIDKMEIAINTKNFRNEPLVKQIFNWFFTENLNDLFSKLGNKDFVYLVISTVLTLMSLMAKQEQEQEQEEEDDDDLEEFEQYSKNNTNFKLYDNIAFEYAKGDKPVCNICKKEYSYRAIKRHINSCINKNYDKGNSYLYYLIIKDSYNNMYYLHISAKRDITLYDLDEYIRNVWVECCGHMSAFFNKRDELSMNMTLKKAFSQTEKLEYIYDFGSSTKLTVEFVKEFKGEQDIDIKTLSRNPLPSVECSECGSKEVVGICSQCMWEGEAYLCKECLLTHECGVNMILPYVNSPRTGVCGYGEWEDVDKLSEEDIKNTFD